MDIETELMDIGRLIEIRRLSHVSLSREERARILRARKLAVANDMSHRRINALLDEGAAVARGELV